MTRRLLVFLIGLLVVGAGLVLTAQQTSANQPKTLKIVKSKAPPKRPASQEKIEADAVVRHIEIIQFANDRLRHLRGDEIDCADCLASSAGEGSATLKDKNSARICKDKWLDFYSKEPVDVRIVFGYQDSDDDNLAGDFLQRQQMIDRITMKCAEDNLVQACDFTRCAADAQGSVDADCFEREVRGPNARMHKMRVRLTASSISASDVVNRALKSEQDAKTEQATSEFYDGLNKADMLLYVGHARDGGGPDFGPAERRLDGSINYDHYRKLTPGLDQMTKELMKRGTTPKILGFFACESERWRTRLTNLAPKSGLILSATPNMPLEVGAAQAFAALDSAIWQRCESSFNRAVNFDPVPGKVEKYDDKKLIPLSLTNFYK